MNNIKSEYLILPIVSWFLVACGGGGGSSNKQEGSSTDIRKEGVLVFVHGGGLGFQPSYTSCTIYKRAPRVGTRIAI